jgi:uncharacterized membrane protein YhaH (DUF805 family)
MWYYSIQENVNGPADEATIRQLIGMGIITSESRVWQESMEEWQEITESVFSEQLKSVHPLPVTAAPLPAPAANPATPLPSHGGQEASSASGMAPSYQTAPTYNPYAPPRSNVAPRIQADDPRLTLTQILFSWQGRIPRRQYWGASIGISLLFVFACFLLGAGMETVSPGSAETSLELMIWLIIIPFYYVLFAITAKRWHDRDKSGWMNFIIFVPFIGPLWSLIECGFLRGTQGRNRFGSDPT